MNEQEQTLFILFPPVEKTEQRNPKAVLVRQKMEDKNIVAWTCISTKSLRPV